MKKIKKEQPVRLEETQLDGVSLEPSEGFQYIWSGVQMPLSIREAAERESSGWHGSQVPLTVELKTYGYYYDYQILSDPIEVIFFFLWTYVLKPYETGFPNCVPENCRIHSLEFLMVVQSPSRV